MSPRITLATAARVLAQIRHDRRTIALLLVVPGGLLALLQQMLGSAAFDRLGAPMVGIFPFITMFLVTSIAMLRERTTGTLERLMTLPLAKLDLLAGYGIAFALLAAVQALVTSGVAFLALGLDPAGSAALLIALAVLDEPTVGLDPVLRRDLWELFHRLAGEGATLLVSSHVMDEAERCDELILMREGRIVATGSPDDLRARTGARDLEDAFLSLAEAA